MVSHRPFGERLKWEREKRYLSQQELANGIKVDVRTIRRWESNSNEPGPHFRRQLTNFFGKEVHEFGPSSQSSPHSLDADIIVPAEPLPGAQEFLRAQRELYEAPLVPNFQGRRREIALLQDWVNRQQSRLIAILGTGGIGKTSLAARFVELLDPAFDCVFWCSLYNAPAFKQIIEHCIQSISNQQWHVSSLDDEDLITLLLHCLREKRCLLVFDNVESLMQDGKPASQYRRGYENYGRLFQRLVEIRHQSCLIITSREKPAEVALLEDETLLVRTLDLQGIGQNECKALLERKGIFGQDADWARLVALYAGNPMSLRIVAEAIMSVFGGDLSQFLGTSESVVGDIISLLDQQFQRLPLLEQEILCWCALEREPVSLPVFYQDFLQLVAQRDIVSALTSLRRRSLIELQKERYFFLQPVILEYVTTLLVKRFVDAVLQEDWGSWNRYALLKADAKEHIRTSQSLLMLGPLAQQLLASLSQQQLYERLLTTLAAHRQHSPLRNGYLAGNILNMLIFFRYDLRMVDFSYLTIRQAYLQDILLPETNFSHAQFIDSVFMSTFGTLRTVAFSPDGMLLAAGTASGDIWLYALKTQAPVQVCRGHTDAAWSIAFNHDGTILASGSDDTSIRLWDVASGRCLKILGNHADRVRAVAFSPDNRSLASGSEDMTLRVWNVNDGTCLQILSGHTDRVWSIAYSPDGAILASGSVDCSIRLWDTQSGQLITTLYGHTDWVRSIAFSSDGTLLASGGDDEQVLLWDWRANEVVHSLQGHRDNVWTLAFSSDGRLLVSGSEDHMLRLWDVKSGQIVSTMQGHDYGIRSVAFSRDGQTIASGGEDQTIRLWNLDGQCLHTLRGYTNQIWSVLFTHDGREIVSCNEDRTIRIWDVQTGTCRLTLRHPAHGARAIALRADTPLLASGGEDQQVHLWDVQTGKHLRSLRGHNGWIRALAFHPSKNLLASGGEDHTILLWDTQAALCLHTLFGHGSWIRALAFHPHLPLLASGSDDGNIRLWDSNTGQCLCILYGHLGRVRSVAFHPKQPLLISASEDHSIRIWDVDARAELANLAHHHKWVRNVAFSADGAFFASSSDDYTIALWQTETRAVIRTFMGHTGRVRWITFGPDGQTLVSGGDDGTIKIWQLRSGQCLQSLICERPYEGMHIHQTLGLTDAQRENLRALGALE